MPLYLPAKPYTGLTSYPGPSSRTSMSCHKSSFNTSSYPELVKLDALLKRKQAPTEDLHSYLTDVGTCCRQLKRPQEQEFEYTLQGLLPNIKRQVLLQGESTVEDIRRIGKLCKIVPADNSMQSTQPANDVANEPVYRRNC